MSHPTALPKMHEGTLEANGVNCDNGDCWCWEEHAPRHAPLSSKDQIAEPTVSETRAVRENPAGAAAIIKRQQAEIDGLQRQLNLRNEQIDGYERQLGIIDAGAERTIGSEIERLMKQGETKAEPAGHIGEVISQLIQYDPKNSRGALEHMAAELLALDFNLLRRCYDELPNPEPEKEERVKALLQDLARIVCPPVKSVCKPSASTDDHVTPSREPPSSSVECPKCRTQLAFEGDECGLCKEEES